MKPTHISAKNFKLLKSEHTIMQECISWLQAHGWYCQRMNSGVIPQTDKNGKTRRIWMGKAGTPDLMAFKDCGTRHHLGFIDAHILFIEVKRPGQVPTFNQKEMMEELTSYGARCLVVHSVEELEQQI